MNTNEQKPSKKKQVLKLTLIYAGLIFVSFLIIRYGTIFLCNAIIDNFYLENMAYSLMAVVVLVVVWAAPAALTATYAYHIKHLNTFNSNINTHD